MTNTKTILAFVILVGIFFVLTDWFNYKKEIGK